MRTAAGLPAGGRFLFMARFRAGWHNPTMSSPGPLYRPFERLVKIYIKGREFEVPEGNTLLRAFQFLAPEQVSYGRFCWNEDCQYCRVKYDIGEGTPERAALSCKLMVEDGMRVVEMAHEIKYCLRELKLEEGPVPREEPASS